jgi:hypothetical protein
MAAQVFLPRATEIPARGEPRTPRAPVAVPSCAPTCFVVEKSLDAFRMGRQNRAMKTTFDRRVDVGGFNAFLLLLMWGLAGFGLVPRSVSAAEANSGDETFRLREVSAFEYGQDDFLRGQQGICQDIPFAQVKAYPTFVSKKPIYGSLQFFQNPKQKKGTSQISYYAVDESQGTGKGHDRLYFDANGDLDLSNDLVIKPKQNPPDRARLNYGGVKEQVVFDPVAASLDFGSAGMRSVQMMPRLLISVYEKEEYKQMSFVRTKLYMGDIKIGGTPYEVRLGNDYVISGRLDSQGAMLVLSPKDGPASPERWWGGDTLMAVHKVRGRFYTFSANPIGDQLTVHPYHGDVGTLEVGPGGRTLEGMTISGSLEGEERAVAVGGEVVRGSPKAARSCELPVGDYRPNYISVQYGHLHVAASFNYHSDGKPRDRADRPAVYGIAIRKDKPFSLDFSNKPDVMFASPVKDQQVKLGDSLEVKAVLVDPKLDMMIRNLDDTTRKQSKGADGQPLGYERQLSLDPKVTITRANGDKVAEGVMPFG